MTPTPITSRAKRDPLEQVRRRADAERQAARELSAAVTAARASGASWRAVADALGVTHQSAMSRFRQAVSA